MLLASVNKDPPPLITMYNSSAESHSSYLECCLPVLFPGVNILPQCALKPANGCISWSYSNVLEWRRTIWCIIIRLLSVQWQSIRVLFGIQVLRQNSETNLNSCEQFESSLAMKWIWRQTRQMFIIITLFVQTITRELCRASHSHVAQAQELSSSVRKDKSF